MVRKCGLYNLSHFKYINGTWPPKWSFYLSVSYVLEKYMYSIVFCSIPYMSTRSILLIALFKSFRSWYICCLTFTETVVLESPNIIIKIIFFVLANFCFSYFQAIINCMYIQFYLLWILIFHQYGAWSSNSISFKNCILLYLNNHTNFIISNPFISNLCTPNVLAMSMRPLLGLFLSPV